MPASPESRLQAIEVRLTAIEAGQRAILAALRAAHERKTPRAVRTARRYALVRAAGRIIGTTWEAAGRLSDLLQGRAAAFGELGQIVEQIRRQREGATSQRRLWEIMAADAPLSDSSGTADRGTMATLHDTTPEGTRDERDLPAAPR